MIREGVYMTQELALEVKQNQFNSAMELYEKVSVYKVIGKIVSLANISLQLYLLYLVLPLSIGLQLQLFSLCAAYVATDFLNGLVHMYMDNNDSYDSLAGPLIAAFHLHHKTPLYKKNNILIVYFNESGAKNWLVGYLLLVALLIKTASVDPVLSFILVYVGILSSVAEVSHYCCHVSDSRITRSLRYAGLFLSKKHHAHHHLADNINYSFLNGLTDPLLNTIARTFFRGYKNTTDKHYAAYTGIGTANR
jgi:sterol desaturase/sphingolipid hydroxylase (fatty acid hydroxylase superfamily)